MPALDLSAKEQIFQGFPADLPEFESSAIHLQQALAVFVEPQFGTEQRVLRSLPHLDDPAGEFEDDGGIAVGYHDLAGVPLDLRGKVGGLCGIQGFHVAIDDLAQHRKHARQRALGTGADPVEVLVYHAANFPIPANTQGRRFSCPHLI